MGFWIREIVGWALVALGLFGYWICFRVFLANDRAIEAGIFAGICTMVFRGGLQLVRVATAARVVRSAAERANSRTPRS
jgi:hypothetical protein